MAYIDKIYGSRDQWEKLRRLLIMEYPEALSYMYECPESDECDEWPLANFPTEIDDWLIKNCDLDFVVKRLKEQYGDYDEIRNIESPPITVSGAKPITIGLSENFTRIIDCKICDMCGTAIVLGECDCGKWKSAEEMKNDHMLLAIEQFNEMKKFIVTGDAPHLGCAVVFFRGDYNDCKKVEKFIHEMKGRPYYKEAEG